MQKPPPKDADEVQIHQRSDFKFQEAG